MVYPGLFNSSYVPSPQELTFIHTPQNQLGPPLTGQILVTLLQGILFVQYYEYLCHYWNEKRWTKWMVHVAFFLCVIKFGYVWWFSWDRFVPHYGDWAYLAKFSPIAVPISISSTLPSAACQIFYIHRCWALSRNKIFAILAIFFLVVTVGSGIAVTWGSGLAAGGEVVASNLILISINLSLASGLLCDIFITTFTCYHLIRHKTGFRETDGVVERLVRGSLESVSGPTIVNLINLITSNFSVNNQWFLVPNLALSHVYACSLLYSVNARKRVVLSTTIMSPPVGESPGVWSLTSISQMALSLFRARSKRESNFDIPLEEGSQGSTDVQVVDIPKTSTRYNFENVEQYKTVGAFGNEVKVKHGIRSFPI